MTVTGPVTSITGWIIRIGENPICWGSRQQKTVTLSSCEAEYVALAEVSKEVIFIIHILEFMEVEVSFPINIEVDNKGAIFIAQNASVKRTRHISTRYHVIRELIRDGTIFVRFVTTDKNLADIFTKNTNQLTFDCHCDGLMVSMK